MSALVLKKIEKSYGKKRVLSNLSLSIDAGQIYGFLGLNGAGKTTAMRILLGLVKQNAGEVIVNLNSVGAMIEIPHGYGALTVFENLELNAKLRKIETKKIDHIIDKLNLTQFRNIQFKHLSLGNKQRFGLARALLHEPKILVLDEPTNGLDPAGIIEIREILLDLAKNKGVAILVSSHLLDEISRIADTIGIIHEGVLLKETSFLELEKELKSKISIHGRNKSTGEEKIIESPNLDKNQIIDLVEKLYIEGFIAFEIRHEKEDLEHYFFRLIAQEEAQNVL